MGGNPLSQQVIAGPVAFRLYCTWVVRFSCLAFKIGSGFASRRKKRRREPGIYIYICIDRERWGYRSLDPSIPQEDHGRDEQRCRRINLGIALSGSNGRKRELTLHYILTVHLKKGNN